MISANGRVARAAALFFSIAALIGLASCGGPGGPTVINGAGVTIELTRSFPNGVTTVGPGVSVDVQAVVFDPNNRGVTWTVAPASFGSLNNASSNSVTYTAPAKIPQATTVTVTATSITNSNVFTSIQIPTSPVTVVLALSTPFGITPFVPLADQTVNQGGTLSLQALVANDGNLPVLTWTVTGAGSLASADGGPLVDTTSEFVTYSAPAAVTSPTTDTISVVSTDSNVSASVRITTLSSGGGTDVAVISVDGGPVPGQIYRNGAFINGVTICNPGQAQVCNTIDGLLVDTGSYGLRILQSAIPTLNLPSMTNGNGEILENCYTLPSGSYLWGPVATADVYVAGLFVSSFVNPPSINGPSTALPVQVIPTNINGGVPDGCSNGGEILNTAQLLGANGILGIGPEPTDCTVAGVNYCDSSTQAVLPNVYYACPTTGCQLTASPVSATALQQVRNPVVGFNQNGVIIDLPPVSETQSSVSGTLTFGFGPVGGATIFTLDSHDNFTTTLNGEDLTASFIDSDSNAFLFPDSMPLCSVNVEFFCPPALTTLSATNTGASQGQSTITFSVDNADSLYSNNPSDAVFSAVAGPKGSDACSNGNGACSFDWGLPFFYGRPVYESIDVCSETQTSCAPLSGGWWAY